MAWAYEQMQLASIRAKSLSGQDGGSSSGRLVKAEVLKNTEVSNLAEQSILSTVLGMLRCRRGKHDHDSFESLAQ